MSGSTWPILLISEISLSFVHANRSKQVSSRLVLPYWSYPLHTQYFFQVLIRHLGVTPEGLLLLRDSNSTGYKRKSKSVRSSYFGRVWKENLFEWLCVTTLLVVRRNCTFSFSCWKKLVLCVKYNFCFATIDTLTHTHTQDPSITL